MRNKIIQKFFRVFQYQHLVRLLDSMFP